MTTKSLTLILFVLLGLNAQAQTGGTTSALNTDIGVKVAPGVATQVTAHGVCKEITFSGNGGIFVPTRTAAEFNSFLAGVPGGVTIGDCAPTTGNIYNCNNVSGSAQWSSAGATCSTLTVDCADGFFSQYATGSSVCCESSPGALCYIAATVTCYNDNDGDGYGAGSGSTVTGTVCPAGKVTDNTDCDDSAYSTTNTCVATGTTFTCGTDNLWAIGGTCTTNVDVGCSSTIHNWGDSVCCTSGVTATCKKALTLLMSCYRDNDGDGYGAGTATSRSSCLAGEVTDNTDCDDSTYSTSNTCGPSVGCGPSYDYCCMEATKCCKSYSGQPDFVCSGSEPYQANGVDQGNGSWGYMSSMCTYGFADAGMTCLMAAP